ncbi:unnamed protein product, partial [Didymodactylos carnosus]
SRNVEENMAQTLQQPTMAELDEALQFLDPLSDDLNNYPGETVSPLEGARVNGENDTMGEREAIALPKPPSQFATNLPEKGVQRQTWPEESATNQNESLGSC